MHQPPVPDVRELRERHDTLLARLRGLAEVNGHDPGRLRIVAITKTWPAELARAAVEAGIGRLGENRVQEAEPKIAAVPGAEWHLVGRLQSNKARRAVRAFALIHSVDSVDLLERLGHAARDEGCQPTFLMQVNVSGEATKAGMTPADLLQAAADGRLNDRQLVGLMTIAPMSAAPDDARSVFRTLRQLRHRAEAAAGIELPELSMGMSADADAAAAEGATLVRIGTALFGTRA